MVAGIYMVRQHTIPVNVVIRNSFSIDAKLPNYLSPAKSNLVLT